MSPAIKRTSESMLVRPNDDGSYSAAWTPSSVGWYSLVITVDGYDMEDVNIYPPVGSLFDPIIIRRSQFFRRNTRSR